MTIFPKTSRSSIRQKPSPASASGSTQSMTVSQIAELAGKTDPQSQNQLVRWVMNKETHAQNIIDSISDYFLT